MRLKIESYGSDPMKTCLTNAETGEVIAGVAAVFIHISSSPEMAKEAWVRLVDFGMEGEIECEFCGFELP